MELPGTIEISPGIWHLRVPLDGHSLGHVNVYALIDNGTTMLIDTGWGQGPHLAELTRRLQRVTGDSVPVSGVVASHFHADHCGLAGELQRESGAWAAIHRDDSSSLEQRYFENNTFRATLASWSTAAGLPPSIARHMDETSSRQEQRITEFFPDRILTDEDVIEHGRFRLDVIHTPGHTAGHICLYERTTKTLFTGDHIFPRINYGPSFRPLGPANPVDEYQKSLTRLAALDVERVCPGHQYVFTDLDNRLNELKRFHQDRMRALRDNLGCRPSTIWEISCAIARKRPWAELSSGAQIAAVAEAWAHLIQLEADGWAQRLDGVPIRWRAV